MKNKKSFWLLIVLSVFAVAFWFLYKPKVQPPIQQATAVNGITATNPAAINVPIAQPSSAVVANTNSSSTGDSKDETDIYAKYKRGLIDKVEVFRELAALKNKQPQDFYGKIIDQYGQPISDVDVTGGIEMDPGANDGAKNRMYKTQSDSDGLFQFTGISGWQFFVGVKKAGYLYGERGEGCKMPDGGKTSPNSRAILTMWKLRGAESLTGQSIEAKIPPDGTPNTFDITTGKKSANGDLQVTLLRSPLRVKRSGQGFDWSVKIGMLRGGLVEENDPYPYWAPESGYEPSFEINMSSNNPAWFSELERNFYIKNSTGQYGRMHIDIYTASTPAYVEFNFTINPSGSQNLEPASTE